MPTAIRIVNDAIIPGAHDPYARGLTPRESQTRLALFILALGAPLIGALFALLTTKRWWANLWSFPRLCTLWFISVAAFAVIVFFQPGRATRSTFVLAIIHGMVEISMISLLLDGTVSQSLIAAMIFALVDFTVTFAVADIGYVFIVASIIGGANDFLIPLLLLYGRQPILAAGGFAHTAAAISVFTAIVHDYGVVTFTLVSFFALWGYVGFTIAGLRATRNSDKEYPVNPMKVSVSKLVLTGLVLVSLVGSTITTILLAYVAPNH